MINNIKAFSKFIDQPLLISKLNKTIPKVMGAGGGILLAKKTYNEFRTNDKKQATKNTLKTGIILASVIASSILAPKFANKITKRSPIENIEKIKEKNKKLIEDYLKNNSCKSNIKDILEKAKDKILSIKDIKTLIKKKLILCQYMLLKQFFLLEKLLQVF